MIDKIFRNVHIGTFSGVPIILHKTYLMFMILVYLMDLVSHGIATAFASMGWIVIIHFFIIVHEYGHIFAARKFGIGCDKIYLTPIGGVACLEEGFAHISPKEEFIISISGPATHLVWLVILYGISFTFNIPIILGLSKVPNSLSIITTLHIIIFLFNLVPAFPMDGGRIFRSIMMSKFNMSKHKATKILFYIGPIILLVVGILLKNFFVFVIVLFVLMATRHELKNLRGY